MIGGEYKVYVWQETPHDDYHAGMAVAVARSEAEALDLIAESHVREWNDFIWENIPGAMAAPFMAMRLPTAQETAQFTAVERAKWEQIKCEVHGMPWAGYIAGGG